MFGFLGRFRQDLDRNDGVFENSALEGEHQLRIFAQEQLQPAFDFGNELYGLFCPEPGLAFDPSLQVLNVIASVEQNCLADLLDIWIGVGEGLGRFFAAQIFCDRVDLGDRRALVDDLRDRIAPVTILLKTLRDLLFVFRQARFVDDCAFQSG